MKRKSIIIPSRPATRRAGLSARDFAVPGFEFAGVTAGIKSAPGKKDLALIVCREGAAVAGLLTTNRLCSAAVNLCRKHLQRGRIKAVVINSGNANAATGASGERDAFAMARQTARALGCATTEVLVCSTGKIGLLLPMRKIRDGINRAVENLNHASLTAAHDAILTTDAYPKSALWRGKIAGTSCRIAVIAKGAGMIHPDMATLLCFIMTDLNVPAAVLNRVLATAVERTLNSLSVDGDTSTNDTVLLLSSGSAGNRPVRRKSDAERRLKQILDGLLDSIAVQIALDGEGATKCLKIKVTGAGNAREARLTARAIGDSSLVKTAMFGNDPNWGRILAAVGYSGARAHAGKLTITLGGVPVYTRGKIHSANLKRAHTYLKGHKIIPVVVHLGMGVAESRYLASDLSYDYVRLNAEYHT